jgi:hypothetical protein
MSTPEHHHLTTLHGVSRLGLVRFGEQSGDVADCQPLNESLHRRAIAIDDHMTGDGRRSFARKALLEGLGQVWQHEQSDQQRNDQHPGELHQNDQADHHRMRPVCVPPVAGGTERVGRPFQTLKKGARLSFELGHPLLIGQSGNDEIERQYRNQYEQPLARTHVRIVAGGGGLRMTAGGNAWL